MVSRNEMREKQEKLGDLRPKCLGRLKLTRQNNSVYQDEAGACSNAVTAAARDKFGYDGRDPKDRRKSQ
jgi:hypothetical protein